jgi:glycosyltransferase involved in cell wall biosynthesis
MTTTALRVSVVVPTQNRAARLRALLGSLREQTLPPDAFEVIVVDDGSSDETASLLEQERARDGLQLTVLRHAAPRGPAATRNAGWQAAHAEVVAFIDDDCVAWPRWLEAGLGALKDEPHAIVQGPIRLDPAEEHLIGPYARTVVVQQLTPYFQTGNIFYPRALLQRVDGFDQEAFTWAGDDIDLGWRAVAAGGKPVFAADAVVYHAVSRLGRIGRLRFEAHWGALVKVYARHPELRRADLARGIFWREHYLLVRALISLLLPRQIGGVSLRFVRRWLAWPYVRSLARRRRLERAGLRHVPYIALRDVVELWAIGRAALRHRTPML